MAKEMTHEEALAELRKHFEYGDDIGLEDMVAKIKAMKKKEEGEGEEDEAKEMESAEANSAGKNVLDEKTANRIKTLEETVSRQSMALLSEKSARFFDEAVRKGQIKPADRQKWEKRYLSDPEGIAEIVKELPVVVQMSEMGSDYDGGEDNAKDPIVQLSEEASKIAKEKKVSFDVALSEARAKNPKLNEAYIAQYRKGGR